MLSFSSIYVVNLREVFLNFKIYGAVSLLITDVGSLVELFSISSKIVSLARESTSYQVLSLLSVTEIISITSSFANLTCEYFVAVPNENTSDIIVPLSAFTFFFIKNFVGAPLSVSKTVTILGSYELENLKLQSSNVLKVVPVAEDLATEPAFTVSAYLKSGS